MSSNTYLSDGAAPPVRASTDGLVKNEVFNIFCILLKKKKNSEQTHLMRILGGDYDLRNFKNPSLLLT